MEATRILIAGIISAVVSYLLGSINFAVITSRIVAGDDVRKHGSGSAGMTNMLRTYGIGPAAVTALGDFFKGSVAMLVSTFIFRHFDVGHVNAGYVAAAFAIIGHMFPVFFHFKGGKGVMTALGVILAINWVVFFMTLAIAVPLIFITRIVSLASITGAITFFVLNTYSLLQTTPGPYYQIIFTFIIAGLVMYMHRGNIRRLNAGTEHRFSGKGGS